MSGHSHWAGIKHKKGVADEKRGRVFSKLLAAVTAAARREPNPEFNPRLRTAVLKAREEKVPAENIERAIKRAGEPGGVLEELLLGAYGPGGAAILVEAVTDSKNRTVAQIKKILSEGGGKWAEPGSVEWAFEAAPGGGWPAKFPQTLSPAEKEKLRVLLGALEDHADVQSLYTNGDLSQTDDGAGH